jgi:hypothetical protein
VVVGAVVLMMKVGEPLEAKLLVVSKIKIAMAVSKS